MVAKSLVNKAIMQKYATQAADNAAKQAEAETHAADKKVTGASIFAYRVTDPERFGIVAFSKEGRAISIEEKPKAPRSNYAVTGLYLYDERAPSMAKRLKPSMRGELEISDLNRVYLDRGELDVKVMNRGFAWLDTGTHESLIAAHQFVQTIEQRQGLKIACPEEIALRKGWIDKKALMALAEPMLKSNYGQYLTQLVEEAEHEGD